MTQLATFPSDGRSPSQLKDSGIFPPNQLWAISLLSDSVSEDSCISFHSSAALPSIFGQNLLSFQMRPLRLSSQPLLRCSSSFLHPPQSRFRCLLPLSTLEGSATQQSSAFFPWLTFSWPCFSWASLQMVMTTPQPVAVSFWELLDQTVQLYNFWISEYKSANFDFWGQEVLWYGNLMLIQNAFVTQ